MNPYLRKFSKIFIATTFIGVLIVSVIISGSVIGLFGSIDDIDIDTLTMNYSSQIFYVDENTGENVELINLSSDENRVWVDIDDIPENLQEAIVSIEDERFYEHNGVDLKRTAKAFFVYVYNKVTKKPTTFGGSTITQQLIKNITNQKQKTAARKIQEISRAVNLEKQISKSQILELYLNSIYLSQGCNGVQTASRTFFGKDVSELNLAECASIAGITQYPTLYDPIVNPEKNKEKQEIVLKKMLDLGKISDEEYEEAVSYELKFLDNGDGASSGGNINSYFIDQVVSEVKSDLIEKGYTEALASKMLYTGGLKIYSTYSPRVQEAIEKIYKATSNFPNAGGDNGAQSSMVVLDPYTGGIKGIVGGIGQKTGNLVLNRASGTLRQPGSTIKPIAVYAPAIEHGVINASDIYYDKKLTYGDWSPQNYDRRFRGAVSVRYALKESLNTVPVQILEELGAEVSFNHLKNNLGITSLVKNEVRSGKVYSDIGLSQLALGGLTDGISLTQLAAAYTPFVNRGIYSSPVSYTSVKDFDGNEILSNASNSSIALSEETAYITAQMLKEVITSGTGASAAFSSSYFTGGKTGTTDSNNDRWFVGFTPYYVCAAWYGYDTPKTIPASGNPCLSVWKKVMSDIHSGLSPKQLECPDDVITFSYCSASGRLKGSNCPSDSLTSFYFTKNNRPVSVCSYTHSTEQQGEDTSDTSLETINVDGNTQGKTEKSEKTEKNVSGNASQQTTADDVTNGN